MKALLRGLLFLFMMGVSASAEGTGTFWDRLKSVQTILPKASKPEVVILASMLPAHRSYVEREVIPDFEKKYNCKVRLQFYRSSLEIIRYLNLDAHKSKPEFSLVLTPYELTKELVTKEMVLPLNEVPGVERIETHMGEFHPIFAAMGKYDDTYYFIPRMIETQTLFYRKSKVADAVTKYGAYREKIDAKLKRLNGFGLPQRYSLEADPNEWDFYDLFTVGYIWSQEEYFGRTFGRISHRSDFYGGAALHVIDRAFQLGATSDEILTMRGEGVTEMLLWEQVFAQTGIYDKESYHDFWRGVQLFNAIKDDRCYLTWLSSIELGTVHGWENDPTMKGYMNDPEDMGVARVPQGISFSLNENGEPRIVGSRTTTLGGKCWGIPKSAPEVKLAFEFATFISNRTWNARESSLFTMLPIRKDLLMNIKEVYMMGWVGDIFKATMKQIEQQEKDAVAVAPRSPKFSEISELYVSAYVHTVTVLYREAVDFKKMERYLADEIEPKVRAVLGENYPEE